MQVCIKSVTAKILRKKNQRRKKSNENAKKKAGKCEENLLKERRREEGHLSQLAGVCLTCGPLFPPGPAERYDVDDDAVVKVLVMGNTFGTSNS